MRDTIITSFLGCLQKEAGELIDFAKGKERALERGAERARVKAVLNPQHTGGVGLTDLWRELRIEQKHKADRATAQALLWLGAPALGLYLSDRLATYMQKKREKAKQERKKQPAIQGLSSTKQASVPIINSGISTAIKRLIPGEAAPVLDKAKGLFERIGEPIKEIPGAVSTLFTPKEQILKQVRATKGLSPEHVKALATPEGQKHVVSATRRAAALQAARGMVPATIIGGGTYKLMKPQQDQYNTGYPPGSTPPPA